MKIITFILILFTIFKFIYCEWSDAAKEACQRVERTFEDKHQIMRNQCVAKCVTTGQLPSFEKLADGTECEIIGFGKKTGICQDGRCQ